MKADQLRELTGPELDLKLRDVEAQIWKIRFQGATGQTEGLTRLRGLKRDLARMQTILREKELSKSHGG
jgi:large subunit ribosomal protein L29